MTPVSEKVLVAGLHAPGTAVKLDIEQRILQLVDPVPLPCEKVISAGCPEKFVNNNI